MSTTGITSWSVDLAEVGAIYPFQGLEVIMLLVGLVFWICWHVITFRSEIELQQEKIAKFGTAEYMNSAIDED